MARLVAILGNLVELAMASHIHLTSDDRFERLKSLLFSTFIYLGTIVGKLLDTKHHTVVGDGHSLHAVSHRLVYNAGNF